MAHVPPAVQTPLSDDVELEDILGGESAVELSSELPAVVVRKDSSCADTDVAAPDGEDVNRLHTPAPFASFEVLSDVDESDMDDITSLQEAQRDAADSEPRVKSFVDDCDVAADHDVQANGSVLPSTELLDETPALNTTSDEHAELVNSGGSPPAQLQFDTAAAGDIPTLVFEDVDANDVTAAALSSPECLVNNDNDVDEDTTQQMWQWSADDQPQGRFNLPHIITRLHGRPNAS